MGEGESARVRAAPLPLPVLALSIASKLLPVRQRPLPLALAFLPVSPPISRCELSTGLGRPVRGSDWSPRAHAEAIWRLGSGPPKLHRPMQLAFPHFGQFWTSPGPRLEAPRIHAEAIRRITSGPPKLHRPIQLSSPHFGPSGPLRGPVWKIQSRVPSLSRSRISGWRPLSTASPYTSSADSRLG